LTESWSAETKFAVVLEATGLSEINLGEYCRCKAFTPNKSRLGDKRSSPARNRKRPCKKKIGSRLAKTRSVSRILERELRRKDKALAETAALLVLRKKLNDYRGTNDNEGNERLCQSTRCSLPGWGARSQQAPEKSEPAGKSVYC
jgi:hypothetical protein